MPTYNTGEFIEKAISSVLEQTFGDFELIIIDQNSTDDTLEIIKQLRRKDDRIKLITSDIRNTGMVRNIGLMASSGEYIAFVDSDDYIEKNMLESLLNVIMKSDSDIAYCDFFLNNYKTGAEEIFHMPVAPQEAYRLLDRIDTFDNFCYPMLWNKLFRKTLIMENNGLFPNFSISEDLCFIFINFLNARRIVYIDVPLYHYLIYRPSSITNVMRHEETMDCLVKALDLIIAYYKSKGVYNLCRTKITEIAVTFLFEIVRKGYVNNNIFERMDDVYEYLNNTFPNWQKALNTSQKALAAYRNADILDKALNKKLDFSGRDVILFSASTGGRALLSAFRAGNIAVTAFCDNNKALHNTWVDGIEVLSPAGAVKRHSASGYFIIAADVKYNATIRSQLLGLGVDDRSIY